MILVLRGILDDIPGECLAIFSLMGNICILWEISSLCLSHREGAEGGRKLR